MRNPKQILIGLVLAAIVFGAQKFGLLPIGTNDQGRGGATTEQRHETGEKSADRQSRTDSPSRKGSTGRKDTRAASKLTTAIDKAYRAKQSEVWVEESGVVTKLLPDDTDGKKHQKWIVRIKSGLTVLFAHNIDIAPRVPLRVGDAIEFRGRYEYSDRGGDVHWTHKHPTGYHAGGWIEHDKKQYR